MQGHGKIKLCTKINLERMNNMKLKKVSKALLAAGMGTIILLGSAAADISLGSGYGQLKDALKTTSKSMAGILDSYTITADAEIRLDDRVLSSQTSVSRYDLVNQRSEGEERGVDFVGEAYEQYFYYDSTYQVHSNNGEEGKPYFAYAHETGWDALDDPFEEEYAADIERIADAAVGSLADVISVENADGKKIYAGHITDAEIPALANALAAFVAKYSFANQYTYRDTDFVDALTENVYVESVSGKAVQREDGILESGVAKIVISGKDAKGAHHVLSAGISIAVTDINSTVVEAFDVNREDVELSAAHTHRAEVFGLRAKHAGTYVCDIVESGDTIEKVGECVLIVDAVTDGTVTGSYAITEGEKTVTARFTGTLWEEMPYRAKLTCTDAEGNVTNAVLSIERGYDHVLRLITNVEFMGDGYSYESNESDYTLYRKF